MSDILFHLAIPMINREDTENFYANILGAKLGRNNDHAMIFDFYGHQLVTHTSKENIAPPRGIYPRHFGIVFTQESDWDELVYNCENKQVNFYQPPRIRFLGELTEHKTFFLQDPAYNILEFKFYRHYEAIFGANNMTAIGDR
ncbi:VOC family protein [Cyanobacterium stanieri LEGE 03274]|uniref:VOC family protein n=1 Tax=Cyanobacterium stanieri LEGE 03274 TaxID=1828756 RepID=A0ABR9V5G0_9CHRO|nr:VOC family protein [Cyanobacterium stanieri]MBE9222079.1 VOC family protein [Cyanobacterium stanieri LEGE 03274]